MRWARASLILLLVSASGWKCAAQRSLAPATGQLTSALPDGAKVVVPDGAFERPTTITIREVSLPPGTQAPPGTVRVGKVYAVEPMVTISLPITITLPYDPALLPPGFEEGSVSIYQVRANGRLSMVGSVTGDPESESAGQNLDIDKNAVTIRVRATATYTLLAVGD